MLFTIVVIFLLKEAAAINVALWKRSTLCELVYLHSNLFDGNIWIAYEVYFVMKYCKGRPAFITVSLDDPYYVHYVVVYEGITKVSVKRSIPSPSRSPLDFFTVSLIEDEQEFSCSRFEKPISNVIPGDGMRVNCMTTNISVSLVQLTLDTNTDFAIAEIEVHTLASGVPDEPVMFYRGCFRNISSKVVAPLDSFQACWKKCHREQYALTGIREGKECHCATDYDFSDELLESSCDEICSDSNRRCGGNDTFSVYIVNVHLPYHRGCSNELAFPFVQSAYHPNVSLCLEYCDTFRIFGIMNEKCACGQDILVMESDIVRCNFTCFGQDLDICGGEDFYSIYGTCSRQDHEYLSCKKLLQCEDFPNKYGVCTSGCKPGFKGEYCIEREAKLIIKSRSHVILIVALTFFVLMALTICMVPIVHMKMYMNK